MTNGEHAEERTRRAVEAARKGGKTRAQRAPLRLVVDRTLVGDYVVEKLECEHDYKPRPIMIGGVSPKKRRCVTCLDLLEKAFGEGN